MDITINKESVFDAVKMNVSVIGRNYKDEKGESQWDKIRIQERDNAVLEQHWGYAYGSILTALDNFLVGHSDSTLTIDDNRRINTSVVSDLSEMVKNILVNRMTSEWMKLKAVEYAPGYSDAADLAIDRLISKLRVKKEPTLKIYNKQS